jgi:hypothetical protein
MPADWPTSVELDFTPFPDAKVDTSTTSAVGAVRIVRASAGGTARRRRRVRVRAALARNQAVRPQRLISDTDILECAGISAIAPPGSNSSSRTRSSSTRPGARAELATERAHAGRFERSGVVHADVPPPRRARHVPPARADPTAIARDGSGAEIARAGEDASGSYVHVPARDVVLEGGCIRSVCFDSINGVWTRTATTRTRRSTPRPRRPDD